MAVSCVFSYSAADGEKHLARKGRRQFKVWLVAAVRRCVKHLIWFPDTILFIKWFVQKVASVVLLVQGRFKDGSKARSISEACCA